MADTRTPVLSPAVEQAVRLVAFGVLYYALKRISMLFNVMPENVSGLWLPSGLLLATLLRARNRDAVGFLIAAMIAGTAASGLPLEIAATTTLANVIECILGAALLRVMLGDDIQLDRMRDVFALSVIPALVCVPIGAAVSAYAMRPLGSEFFNTWRTVWMSNTLGVLVVAPVMLSWLSRGRQARVTARGVARGVMPLLVVAALALLMVWSWQFAKPTFPFGWLLFPIFVWSGLKRSAREVSLLGLMVGVITAYAVTHGTHAMGSALTASQGMTTLGLLLSMGVYSALLISAARVESQRALAASEASAADYRSIFEGSIQGIFRSAPDGRFLVANPALARMHGFETPAELMRARSTHNTYVNPNDRSVLLDALRRDGMVQGHALHVVKDNGEEAWHSVNARMFTDENGETLYFEGMVEDITERKHAELERQYLTNSLGQRVKELTGLHKVSRILQEDSLTDLEVLERVIAVIPPAFQYPDITAARIRYVEYEVASPNFSETQWLLHASHAIEGGEGLVLDVVYLEERPRDVEGPFFAEERSLADSLVEMIGVTLERRQAERAYHRSQERLQLALTGAGMLVWEFDVDTQAIEWSGSIKQATGLNPNEAPTSLSEFLALVHPDDREHIQQSLDAALNDPLQKGIFEVEYRRGRVGNGSRWLSSNGRVQRDADGRGRRIRGLSHDITNVRELEQSLHQSQKLEAVGRLAGGVAHDFNNLLTVMSGYLEMLLHDDLNERQEREAIEELQRVTHRAEALTRQLLAFSRKSVVAPVALDLNVQIRDMEKLLGRLIGARISLVVRLDSNAGKVRADRAQIEQMVMNLVVNARDAMPTGGVLTVTTARVMIDDAGARARGLPAAGAWFMLSVRDTGLGMDEETRTHIFEPFFTTKGTGNGTGMGLSVVLGVVERSNGRVLVESEQNAGTTFTVYLPIVEHTTPVEPMKRVSGGATRRGSERILLVEDDDALRQVVSMALEGQGYTVRAARHGEEALSFVESDESHYDLLLTDVVLPRVGGRELARQIFGHDENTRVLYMSGYTDDAVLVHGVEAGQVNFLQKPFAPTALVKKVREVLDS